MRMLVLPTPSSPITGHRRGVASLSGGAKRRRLPPGPGPGSAACHERPRPAPAGSSRRARGPARPRPPRGAWCSAGRRNFSETGRPPRRAAAPPGPVTGPGTRRRWQPAGRGKAGDWPGGGARARPQLAAARAPRGPGQNSRHFLPWARASRRARPPQAAEAAERRRRGGPGGSRPTTQPGGESPERTEGREAVVQRDPSLKARVCGNRSPYSFCLRSLARGGCS